MSAGTNTPAEARRRGLGTYGCIKVLTGDRGVLASYLRAAYNCDAEYLSVT